uniref:MACPF domain-containing protein n=1 Tax=Ciona savignyi TaxID=51511 RepID=H2YXY4_CIOSA
MNQPRNFIFSHQFQLLLRDLPKAYDYGKYEAVIRNFGTHYYSSGSLGGRYEYIYRYSKSALRQSGLTESQQQSCLSIEASIAFLGIGLGGGSSRCSSNSLSRKHAGSFTNAATEVVSNVRGGTSGTAASLSFNLKSKKNFEAWVNSLKQNPAVVRYTLSPLSAVFNDVSKKLNMNRAIRFYLSRYDYAKCPSSCFNYGQLIVVNDGKVCKCLCAANFGGISCELRG